MEVLEKEGACKIVLMKASLIKEPRARTVLADSLRLVGMGHGYTIAGSVGELGSLLILVIVGNLVPMSGSRNVPRNDAAARTW